MNRPETFRILHPFGPFVNGPYENTQGLACLKWKLISLMQKNRPLACRSKQGARFPVD
jgi:hypothetical protein